MAIKIQTEKTFIPVEIGDLKFKFDITDESIVELRKNADKVRKELENIEADKNDEKALEQTKDVLRQGYTLILGEGAFEKIYEISPSVIVCMKYFEQVVRGIEEELQEMGFSQSQMEKAQKYIRKKK